MKNLRERFRTLLITCVFCLSASAQLPGEYDVTIVFTGIVTFVPGNDSAILMIPNLNNVGAGVGDDAPVKKLPSHIAYVLARKDVMPRTEPLNQDDDFDDAFNEGNAYHFIELNGDQIVLDDENDVAMLNKPLSYSTAEPASGTVCPDEKTKNSLYWIASQRRVFGGVAQKPNLARFDPRPRRDAVLARARLSYGTLEAHVTKPGHVWEFRDPKSVDLNTVPTVTQALAQEVHWKFRAALTPFVLNLVSFEGTTRRIAFQPDNGKIVIVIAQTTFGDTGPMAKPDDYGDPGTVDLHYALHHTSIENDPEGKGPVPHRVDSKQCDAAMLDEPTLMRSKSKPPATYARKKSEATHAGHASGYAGGPAPSGLNCPPSLWP